MCSQPFGKLSTGGGLFQVVPCQVKYIRSDIRRENAGILSHGICLYVLDRVAHDQKMSNTNNHKANITHSKHNVKHWSFFVLNIKLNFTEFANRMQLSSTATRISVENRSYYPQLYLHTDRLSDHVITSDTRVCCPNHSRRLKSIIGFIEATIVLLLFVLPVCAHLQEHATPNAIYQTSYPICYNFLYIIQSV